MNKEIRILINMCKTNKEDYTAEELATFLNLKFKEGAYPYLRKLQQQEFIYKKERGIYSINPSSHKIKIIKFIIDLFGNDAFSLFSIHTKNILQRFSIDPILKANELPYHNLKIIEEIAKKTKIIYSFKDKNAIIYLIRTWDEPTRKLLDFFGITLQFDEEEYRHKVIKHYSANTIAQAQLTDKKQEELAEINMKYYLEAKDFILDKLKNIELAELSVIDILTDKKTKELNKNLFEITRRINDWKIKYIYNTDKIEGNLLTLEEVRTILTLGSASIKKEKKDILETTNSRTALDNIFDTTNELTVDFIKKLHLATQQGIDQNAGAYKQEENCIVDDGGTLIDTTTPSKFVEERMNSLTDWYHKNKDKIHPLVLASVTHNQFVYIHPFSDGNGRVARLLFNFILIKKACFPIIFYNDQKHKYYSSLRQTKDGDMKAFIQYSSDTYREQLESF